MNLLNRILAKFKDKPPQKVTKPFTDEQSEELHAAVKIATAPVIPPKPKPKGRVIKQTRHSEFNPDSRQHGGRVVKVMPRQLQKIKAAQEKVENDSDQPRLEDLED